MCASQPEALFFCQTVPDISWLARRVPGDNTHIPLDEVHLFASIGRALENERQVPDDNRQAGASAVTLVRSGGHGAVRYIEVIGADARTPSRLLRLPAATAASRPHHLAPPTDDRPIVHAQAPRVARPGLDVASGFSCLDGPIGRRRGARVRSRVPRLGQGNS